MHKKIIVSIVILFLCLGCSKEVKKSPLIIPSEAVAYTYDDEIFIENDYITVELKKMSMDPIDWKCSCDYTFRVTAKEAGFEKYGITIETSDKKNGQKAEFPIGTGQTHEYNSNGSVDIVYDQVETESIQINFNVIVYDEMINKKLYSNEFILYITDDSPIEIVSETFY